MAPKILAFAGSLRKDSVNKKLVRLAAEDARKWGAEVTLLDFADYPLPVYDGDLEAREGLPENAKKLKSLFLSHHGFLISSPESNSSISGTFKNIIDWVSRPSPTEKVYLEPYIGKVAAIMSASPGKLGGLRGLVHLRDVLGNIFTLVLPDQLILPNAYEAFDESGKLKDTQKAEHLKKLSEALCQMTQKLM